MRVPLIALGLRRNFHRGGLSHAYWKGHLMSFHEVIRSLGSSAIPFHVFVQLRWLSLKNNLHEIEELVFPLLNNQQLSPRLRRQRHLLSSIFYWILFFGLFPRDVHQKILVLLLLVSSLSCFTSHVLSEFEEYFELFDCEVGADTFFNKVEGQAELYDISEQVAEV